MHLLGVGTNSLAQAVLIPKLRVQTQVSPFPAAGRLLTGWAETTLHTQCHPWPLGRGCAMLAPGDSKASILVASNWVRPLPPHACRALCPAVGGERASTGQHLGGGEVHTPGLAWCCRWLAPPGNTSQIPIHGCQQSPQASGTAFCRLRSSGEKWI